MRKCATTLSLAILLLSPGPRAYAALARVARTAPVKTAPGLPGAFLPPASVGAHGALNLPSPQASLTLPAAAPSAQTAAQAVAAARIAPAAASQDTIAPAHAPVAAVTRINHSFSPGARAAMPVAQTTPALGAAPQAAAPRAALARKIAAGAVSQAAFAAAAPNLSPAGLKNAAGAMFERSARPRAEAVASGRMAPLSTMRSGLRHTDPETGGDFDAPLEPAIIFHSESVAKIAFDLERLAKEDPAAGLAKALDILRRAETDTELRPEVLNAAMRLFAVYPVLGELLPRFAEILRRPRPDQLTGITFSGRNRDMMIQGWQKRDTLWPLRRAVLRILRDRADEFPADPELRAAWTDALQRAWAEDLNPSVRLMAQDALARFGEEPAAAEPFVVDDAMPKPALDEAPKRESPVKRMLRSFALILLVWIGIGYFFGPKEAPPTPAEQAQIVQQLSEREVADIQADPNFTAAQKKAYIELRRHHLTLEERARKDYEDIEQAEGLGEFERRMLKEERRQSLAEERQAAQEEAQTALAQKAAKGGMGIMGMVLNALIFVGILVGFQYFMMRKQMGGAKGGAMSIFGSKSRKVVERPQTRFHDIAGIDEVVDEAREVVDFLKNPGKYSRLGGKAPKGVLLEGGPGLGKTALARAIAGESNAAFFNMSGSDFIEMFVGVGAKRVRELFAEAAQNSPAIIFIDEIDAIGKQRGGKGQISGGHDEREQTLNALLAAMDGFDNSRGVVVIAATNRIDVLDEALVRTGRFDKKITVGKPDLLGREAIMQIHGRTVRFAPDVDMHFIAERTWQMSGSDLEAVVDAAARFAARRGADAVSNADLSEAVDQVVMGAARPLPLTEQERRETAIHEAGHVLGALFGGADRVAAKVTIMPRGPALGFADIRDPKDKFSRKQSELEAQIVELLGGYVAEKKYIGETTTGPSNDLERATAIARHMVERLGMGGEELGLAVAAPRNEFAGRDISEERARKIDARVRKILDDNLAKMNRILEKQEAVHSALVEALMQKETLDREEILDIKRRRETKDEGGAAAPLAGGAFLAAAPLAGLMSEQAAAYGMLGVFSAISLWSMALFAGGLWKMIQRRGRLGAVDGIGQLVYLARWMLASFLLVGMAHPFNLVGALIAFAGPGLIFGAWKKWLRAEAARRQ